MRCGVEQLVNTSLGTCGFTETPEGFEGETGSKDFEEVKKMAGELHPLLRLPDAEFCLVENAKLREASAQLLYQLAKSEEGRKTLTEQRILSTMFLWKRAEKDMERRSTLEIAVALAKSDGKGDLTFDKSVMLKFPESRDGSSVGSEAAVTTAKASQQPAVTRRACSEASTTTSPVKQALDSVPEDAPAAPAPTTEPGAEEEEEFDIGGGLFDGI